MISAVSAAGDLKTPLTRRSPLIARASDLGAVLMPIWLGVMVIVGDTFRVPVMVADPFAEQSKMGFEYMPAVVERSCADHPDTSNGPA